MEPTDPAPLFTPIPTEDAEPGGDNVASTCEPPYSADRASLFRVLAAKASRPEDREAFARRCLVPMVPTEASSLPDGPATAMRLLAGVLVAGSPVCDPADEEPLWSAAVLFPAGAGNTPAEAAEAEHRWLVKHAPVFLQALTRAPVASLRLAAINTLAREAAEADTVRLLAKLGIPRNATFDTDPTYNGQGAMAFTLDCGLTVRMVAERGGGTKVYVEVPRVGAPAAIVHVGLQREPGEGFTPNDAGRKLLQYPKVRDALSDVLGAVQDRPFGSAQLRAGLDLSTAEAQIRDTGRYDQTAAYARGADKPWDAESDNPLAEFGLTAKDFGEIAAGKIPESARKAADVKATSHYAKIRALRMALVMGAKEFFDAILRRPLVLPDPTLYAEALTEWEGTPNRADGKPTELSPVELLVIASGFEVPIPALAAYLDGKTQLHELLPQVGIRR